MKALFRAALTAVILALLWSPTAVAQDLEEGEWKVMMYTPGGEVATAIYDVERVGRSTRATMKWRDGETPVEGLELDGDLMTFAWDPGFPMQCRLERSSRRQFKGACRDGQEHLGPAVFSPPGVDVFYSDFDFEKAFEVWNVSKEAYIRERYPQPKTESTPVVSEPKELPSRLVGVEGRTLNLVELGSGDVTVVLESGVGDDHKVWRQVQEALATHARVISYDRAGLGLSDAASDDRSPLDMARDLHDLLEAGGYAPPFLLVGHHTGAFTVRAFENMYPSEVAGLVLIDPAHEDEDERYGTLDASGWEQYVSRKRAFYSAVSKPAAREFDAYLRTLRLNAFEPATDLPTVVLSGQKSVEKPRWVGETKEGLAAKKAMHQSLASALNAELVVSKQSSGSLHLEDPDAIVRAVKKILESVEE